MKRFKTSDGLSLAYRDTGQGVTVLCLAGLTRNMEDFAALIAARPDACRYICLDSRGRGASDYASDPETYTVAQEAQDALALLDHLNLEQVAILGTSRGGLLAMAIAALAPDRLKGVFFNDVGPQLELSGLQAIAGYIGLQPSAKTHAQMATALQNLNRDSVAGLSFSDWEALSRRSYTQTTDGLMLRYDPRLRDGVMTVLKTPETVPDLWPYFAALSGLPVAVLRGANSDLLSPETLKQMRQQHPGLLAADVPGRGHVPFLDEAESLSLFDTWIQRITT